MAQSELVTPPTLHRIWIGPKKIPSRSEEFWAKFAALNPGWELRTWSERDVANLELSRLFPDCAHPAIIADLARIEILWKHGGIYVDTDVEPVRPFESLRRYRLAVARVPPGFLATAVIVSEKGNGGLRNMMEVWLSWATLPKPTDFPTGPYALTFALSGRSDLAILPREVFYPWMWDEAPCQPFETTLSCHHWDKSWWSNSRRARSLISLRLRRRFF